jgi:ribonuclease HI
VIPRFQGGFRRGQAAEDQVLALVQSIHSSWAKGLDHVAIMFDVQKAFDTVWHDGLVYKLDKLALLPLQVILWTRDYLGGRSVKVRFGNATSTPRPVASGLPQGAILSPILFSVFVCDLPWAVRGRSLLAQYADDTSLHQGLPRGGPTRARALANFQDSLNLATDWFKTWKLSLAPTKTRLRVFTPLARKNIAHTQPPLSLMVDGVQISLDRSPATRYLGVWLDNHLTLTEHIRVSANKATSRVNVLRALCGKSWGPCRQSRINLYKTWIRPILEYGALAFSTAPERSLAKLDAVQKSALQLCLTTTKTVSLMSLEAHARVEPLGIRRYTKWVTTAAKLTNPGAQPTLLGVAWNAFCATRSTFGGIPVRQNKRFTGQRLSPFHVMRGLSRAVSIPLTPRHVERYPLPLTCPWVDSSVHPDDAPPLWPRLGSATSRTPEQTTKAHKYTNEVLTQAVTEGSLIAVSDGSSSPLPDPTGHSSCAVVFSVDGGTASTRHAFQIDGVSNNVGAELLGILTALQLYVKEHANSSQRLEVFCDCQPAVLQARGLVKPSTSNFYEVTSQIRELINRIRSSGSTVTVSWVPGHCGHPLNEAADDAANLAQIGRASCRERVCIGV